MGLFRFFTLLLVILGMGSCAWDEDLASPIRADLYSAFDFTDGTQGWNGGFSGYPIGYEDSLQLVFAYDDYPPNSGFSGKSITISGKNPHRQLFYFIQRKVDGLQPQTRYLIEYDIHFLINILEYDNDETGDVYIKAGGLSAEPLLTTSESNTAFDGKSQELNMDIGSEPSLTGQDVITIGNVQMPQLSYSKLYNATSFGQQFTATTNDQGAFWLIIGFDSDIDAHLAFYFSRINVFYTRV